MKHAALHIEWRCEIRLGPLPSVAVSRFLACTANGGRRCHVPALMRWIQMEDLVDFLPLSICSCCEEDSP